jgi:predicted acetyltransferase
MIEKTLFELDRLFMRRDIRIIGYRNEGQLEGYMVFRFEKAHDNNMVMNNLIIEEWVYLNTEALGEFLTFLHTQDDQIHRVAVQTLDPSFYYLLQDPRNETNNVIPHVYHEMHTSGVGLMYKVLNIEGLFHALKDYNFNHVSCRMKLVVSDTFESKIHSLTIHFIEGKAMVLPCGESDFVLSLDISDFSALMMGAVTFETLHQFGIAQVSNDHYIPLIEKVFLTPQKPVCLSGF